MASLDRTILPTEANFFMLDLNSCTSLESTNDFICYDLNYLAVSISAF